MAFTKKRTWINSIVILSAKKLEINVVIQLYQCEQVDSSLSKNQAPIS